MSLEDKLANMNIYDAKKYFRKAQNVVFNYTEMEAKVREATNNEPWGASSSLMEQISQGTYNLREREEILGMIFRRFTEKSASEWRQIYKALQLLDYLIRHGSERFIDDTRSSINLIKMLESFHYVDSQGRDQGINVRTRAKALAELLGDDGTIRSERKKARETSKKLSAVAGGLAASTRQTSKRYPTRSAGISISADTDDEDEEQNVNSSRGNFRDNSPAPVGTSDSGFFHASNSTPKNSLKPENGRNNDEVEEEDDDFADFQSAAPVVQTSSIDASSQKPYVNDLLGDVSFSSSFTSSSIPTPSISATSNTYNIAPAVSEPKKADPFSNLFASAKSSQETTKQPQTPQTTSKTQENIHVNGKVDEDEDDDGFGELMEAGSSQQPSSGNQPPASNEIDLLSF